MSWRPHSRAQVDPSRPRAWATCERCGRLFNHYMLRWDRQWQGTQIMNLHHLVCDDCSDRPQEQLRTTSLPADPSPIANPRPEGYEIDETNYRATEGGDYRITENGNDRVTESG